MTNLENHQPLAQDPQTRRIRQLRKMRLLLLLALLLAIAVSLYAFRDDIRDAWDRYRAEQQLSQAEDGSRLYFDADASNVYVRFGSSLAVLSQTRFMVYDAVGNIQYSTQVIHDRPAMAVADDCIALYSRGCTTVTLADRNSIRGTVEVSGAIVDAQITASGAMAITHGDERYRSVVSVYNNRQKLVYEWKTSEYYVLTAALSPDGKTLTAVAMGQENAEFRCRLLFFRTDQEQRQAEYQTGAQLIYSLYYMDSGTLCAVGDTGTLVLSTDGELLRQYDYGNYELTACSQSGHLCVLALVDANTGISSRLVTLSKDEEPIEAETGEVRDLSVCGDYVAILHTEGVELRRTDLSEVSGVVTIFNVRELFCTEDGRILLIYNSEAGFVDFVTPFS